MKKKYLFLFLILLLTLNIPCSFSANVVVTNTNDNGTGSLRDAINIANLSFTYDTIKFNIPISDGGYNATTGLWTIIPDSTLPYVFGGHIVIDGTTQTANVGNTNLSGPEIALYGSDSLDYGLALVSANNVVKGLIIGHFNNGILVSGPYAQFNLIEENYLGVDCSGTNAYPNGNGVLISSDLGSNIITNNVISGNVSEGVLINLSTLNHVYHNKLGTDVTGTIPLSNTDGVLIYQGTHNTIGGRTIAERNIISGNINSGIILNGHGTDGNLIQGNYIGTDTTGLLPVSNYTGIIFKSQSNHNTIGGDSANYRNIISGNYEIGIYVESSDSNRIVGNYVGPDITGNAGIWNGDSLCQGNGIEINTVSRFNTIGGYNAGERNVISGNRVYGFIYYGNVSYNPLIGNYIGTNATGTAPLSNATGICVDGGSNHNLMANNLLSGNISYGIFIVTTGTSYNQLKGNLIGTNAAGTDTIPNDIGLTIAGGTRHNMIGDSTAAGRNIISGNRYDGIEIADQKTDSNSVVGNYIGTDITGTLRLGNSIGIGLATNPRHTLISGNVISGNKRMGMVIYQNTDSNRIVKNKIGTAANGTSPLGNGSAGLVLAYGPKWNVIGEPGFGNIIAYNDSDGVVIVDAATKYNKISSNSIWGNMGLGIDLFPPFVNANDPGDNDTGPNDLMNYAVISLSEYHSFGNYAVVKGLLDTHHPELCRVEIFKAVANFFSYGDGKTYMGYAVPDTAGNWSDTLNGIVTGDVITTTATDELMNTSEFSANKTTTLFVGINENEMGDGAFIVYPNPVTDHLFVECFSKNDDNFEASLFDVQGRVLLSATPCMNSNAKHQIELDLKNLSSGIYFIKAIKGNNVSVSKIIKIDN